MTVSEAVAGAAKRASEQLSFLKAAAEKLAQEKQQQASASGKQGSAQSQKK
ncbi:hypothetical protein AFFFEF_03862 [Methylorubrum extorquens]|jgi:hypothetical protein